MAREVNLRQIEAFKAVIETGTVSAGAGMLNISQPAMSQLIAHMETDAGLKLFDRVKGRLVPTDRGMRLYEEIGRIFAGVRQVQNALEAIRREEQGTLAIGVMPALASSFIPQALPAFVRDSGNVFCSVQQMSSQWILDWLIARKLDVGLVGAGFDNPYVVSEPLIEHPLVCIMPSGHPLSAKTVIEPNDLEDVPFVTLHPDTNIGRRVQDMFEAYNVRPRAVAIANVAPTLCECVAAGLGVTLIHPLSVSGHSGRLAVRRFEPEIPYHYQLCRMADTRNAEIIDAFAERLRLTAAEVSRSLLTDS
ncbi:LysR substrate-binding domain-containing protein [Sphingomonas crocodyli]|uniref:LysR family transcriptional regulator n=1 Tax=Sphingomonas crocodyli TaxID=1979270 RepID=A0A437M792_9SPHN|nr:LysR substrate-binding domain-containing protein [Sphingomonas crocodyli]RVT93519.1 LysR family transcriptional regulator [Sphingomonas crocodyli]